jgi:magnesium transporter
MIGKLLYPELKDLIEQRKFGELRQSLVAFPPADIAEILTDLTAEEKAVLLRMLPYQLAADVFEYLTLEDQTQLLHAMGREEVAKIINEMSPDDRTALLEELPNNVVTGLLHLLSPIELKLARQLLGYPEHSVGRLMTPDFIDTRDDWTVQQTLDHIRREGHNKETLNVVYVLDPQGTLIADVRIGEFLLRPLDKKVKEFRGQNPVTLKVTESDEEAAERFKKYDRAVLPVVDSAGHMVGIVTVDDVVDVLEREATEDIQKVGGSEALDQPYLTIRLPRMIRKRAPWLVILFLSEMLTATAMGFFEKEIARAVVLALFVPLIISSGGNSGSQATTLVIRAMAIGEVALRDWWRVMRREVFSGLTLGIILGAIGFLRIAVWSSFSRIYGPHWPLIALTIFLSLTGVVMWGTLAGSMLPFLLRRLGLDPATASAPFVATLVDVTGLVIYFTVAMFVLRGTLL